MKTAVPRVAHCVPAELVEQGSVSTSKSGNTICTEPGCGARYDDHTGQTCRVCRRPVEHHQDAAAMRDEIASCAHLSEARRHAGKSLRPFEDWCIAYVDRQRSREGS